MVDCSDNYLTDQVRANRPLQSATSDSDRALAEARNYESRYDYRDTNQDPQIAPAWSHRPFRLMLHSMQLYSMAMRLLSRPGQRICPGPVEVPTTAESDSDSEGPCPVSS